MNIDFASYVREASFALTLSAEMIESLLAADRDIHHPKMGFGIIYSKRTSNALYRRGLIAPTAKSVPSCWRESAAWPYCYDLTEAGKLCVGLLKEAGFKTIDLPELTSEEPSPEITLTLKPTA